MRQAFLGYYAPTEAEYRRLWQEGLIVLDTNVLLDLYRLPASARDDLLSLLDILKDRLWIPYQVALEFQRRRLTVISAERKVTEDALRDASDLFGEVQKIVATLQIDKRGLGIESDPLLANLKGASDKLVEAINSAHKSQLDIAVVDPIRDRLDKLLGSNIGHPPADQSQLDALLESGDDRFRNKIPPGFLDADKDKNPSEALFHHDGLCYQRKFGDLIIWRQLLNHVRAKEIKSVLFVTADRKEDWWWREKGKTIGPRPELVREMVQTGRADLFWMYSSDQFLESAKQFTKAKVAEKSVSEIQDVVRFSAGGDVRQFRLYPAQTTTFDFAWSEEIVFKWLQRSVQNLKRTRSFPDFIADTVLGPIGYEVKYIRNASRLLSSIALNAISRGYVEVNEGRLAAFALIAVVDEEQYGIPNAKNRTRIENRLDELQLTTPINEIVVGYVTESGDFEVIARRSGPKTIDPDDWVDEPSGRI